MTWQKISISQFGGPEVLDLIEESTIPEPGPGEVRIKVLAAGTGFTDIFIRRGRYPDYKGPLPFIPGYDIVGLVDKVGLRCGITTRGSDGGRSVRGRRLHPIRDTPRTSSWCRCPTVSIPAEAVCIPLAYLTAFQMLTRYRATCAPVQRSSRLAPPELWARHCSTWRAISV